MKDILEIIIGVFKSKALILWLVKLLKKKPSKNTETERDQFRKTGRPLWLIPILFLNACSTHNYHYYGMEGMDYSKGKMLGPTEADDLPFSACEPSEEDRFVCILMFSKEFFDMKERLEACELEN